MSQARNRGASTLGMLLSVGALAALGIGWWLSGVDAAQGEAVDPARVLQVERRTLVEGVNANGRVEPLARVAVMSRASGIIEELYVEEGDRVELDQPLAELDREQLQAQLAQDQADQAAASARVAAAEARVAEAEVRMADPEIEFLQREAARLRMLEDEGQVSVRDLDNAERGLAMAQHRLARIDAELAVLRASLAEARAALESADAELERSTTALEEATILCPMPGIVLVRDKEIGDGVSSILTAGGNATQILTIGDLSSMHVEARVDEVDLGKIQEGMPARITVDAHRGRILDGRVERIAPAGSVDDNGIVTFEVEVSVQDPDGLLRPDMTADAKLVLALKEDALTLPQRAITREEDGSWSVLRVLGEGEEARAEKAAVEIGLSDGLVTEILSGLTEGESVLLPELGP